MNTDLVILFYYACFMGMTGWVLSMYAGQMVKSLENSDKNPVPEGMMERYVEEQHNVSSEDDEAERSSEADAESTDAEEPESQGVEWGGEEEAPAEAPRGRTRERIAIARFHGEHED